MVNVIFVCHGNICRSPMAEFVFRDLCAKNEVLYNFNIASAGVSNEEEGNPVHRGTASKLAEHGISCSGKYARQLDKKDLSFYDYILIMDKSNLRGLERIARWSGVNFSNIEDKVFPLLEFAGRNGDIADPWYTGNFDETWKDVYDGCVGFLEYLKNKGQVF